MNATKIVSEENFELTIGSEPFVYGDFFRIWHVLIYSTLLVLAYVMADSIVKK